MRFQGQGVTVYIADDVVEIWYHYRQIEPLAYESFGVLIGSSSEDKTEFWLESVTTPKVGDTSSRHSFLLQDSYHQKEVNRTFLSSHGQSIYLGTWHTHPQKLPSPSSIDKADWKRCIRENKDRQLFFAIIGTEEISLFTQSFNGFRKLAQIKYKG